MSSQQAPQGAETCDVREVLDVVSDKWSLYVVANLGGGPRRFTELKRAIDGVSQKMLTLTLRHLERDGLLTRTVHAVMPPNVTYELTPLGTALLHAAGPLIAWSTGNLAQIAAARAEYDRKTHAHAATA